MDATHPAEIEQSMRVTQTIAAAFMASIVIYMVIAAAVGPTTESPDSDRLRDLATAFLVLSVGSLLVARVIFQSRLRMAREGATPIERLQRYRTAVVLAFALRETVAIYGLVLSFATGDGRWVFGFGLVALATMAMGWPRRSQMVELTGAVQPIG
jgi:F0F1-type ATP synthase membrane subunit c/vacuolar-type H+-ATPase subunit K